MTIRVALTHNTGYREIAGSALAHVVACARPPIAAPGSCPIR